MKNGFFDRPIVLEMLDDDAPQQIRSHLRVPDPFGIDHYDRPVAANAEAGSLAALDAMRAEEQALALQEIRQQRVQLTAASFRRAETPGADKDVPRVGLHSRPLFRSHRAKISIARNGLARHRVAADYASGTPFAGRTMAATATRTTASVDPAITGKGYVHPEVLVSTSWLADRLDDPNLRIIESDEDVLLYDTGHIPGAQKVDWHQDLNDPVLRDYVSSEQFEKLLREKGIDENTTVVFYGDKNNWWATYAFWVFQLFGFTNAKLLDGGRIKWEQEGRPFETEVPHFPKTSYKAPKRSDERIRAFFHEVREHSERGKPLIDVRSPEEYTGQRTHMPDYPQEGTLRGGHIKGAKSVPWARAANSDGSFKDAPSLRAIYEGEKGLRKDDDIVAYCRIGERSSHTWFVLTYLLGYDRVRNYDGSWTEWGNAVQAPIEKGPEK
jgi:thiosulfate/3-mercaptopyruvate sulfurtransferase